MSIYTYVKSNIFEKEEFFEDIKTLSKDYFNEYLEIIDKTDYEELEMRLEDDPDDNFLVIKVECRIINSENYFVFTLDDNGNLCIDIFLNGKRITAGFKSNSSEKEMMEDIKNIFNDISSEKTGFNHNIYF